MPNGKSRPLAAPFFNQDALWKHGIAYAGNAPALVDRQNHTENGNKSSRRDHKTPFQTNPKEPTAMPSNDTHTQSRKSSPAVTGSSSEEMGAVFKDILNEELPKEFRLHLSPAFDGLARSLEALSENQAKVHTAVGVAKVAAEFGAEQARLAKVSADGAAEDARMAADAAKAAPAETVRKSNEFFNMDNVKGDGRTLTVGAVIIGVVWGVVTLGKMIFGDPEPMVTTPVRKVA